MTIQEAIDKVCALKPNQYSPEDMIRWLSDLDTQIFRDIIMEHEHPRGIKPFTGYTAEDVDKALIAKQPYEELYIAYLKMKIDEENGETQRYNNSVVMFNSYYDNYAKWINKTRRPLKRHGFVIW